MNTPAAALMERVGIALLHSLWQGSLVGMALIAALLALRHAAARVRYLVCCLALVVMLLLPMGTFLVVRTERPVGESGNASHSKLVTSAAAALEAAATLLPAERPREMHDDHVPLHMSGN